MLISSHRTVTGWINTLRPRQNGCHFADDIFKCIFMSENLWISLKNSLKFVPKVRINSIPALVQIMAWRRSGDKPLSEPMVTSSLTHICVSRPQWVNTCGGNSSRDVMVTFSLCCFIDGRHWAAKKLMPFGSPVLFSSFVTFHSVVYMFY